MPARCFHNLPANICPASWFLFQRSRYKFKTLLSAQNSTHYCTRCPEGRIRCPLGGGHVLLLLTHLQKYHVTLIDIFHHIVVRHPLSEVEICSTEQELLVDSTRTSPIGIDYAATTRTDTRIISIVTETTRFQIGTTLTRIRLQSLRRARSRLHKPISKLRLTRCHFQHRMRYVLCTFIVRPPHRTDLYFSRLHGT